MATVTSDLSQDQVHRVKARRKDLELGKYMSGVSPATHLDTPPVWYEPESFRRAQKLFSTYKALFSVSQLYGLLLNLYNSDTLFPLLATGQSRTISKLFSRHLATMLYVEDWYRDDPFDKQSKSFRSFQMVRAIHFKLGSRLNQADGREEDGQTELWMSQYSMCDTQFSFFALMTIFPKQLGFHKFKAHDFHAIFHFWRVIGYCIGIDDRFNMCTGSDEEVVELCRQWYFEVWLPVLRDAKEETGVAMAQGICQAMRRVNPLLDYNALMRYGAPFLQLDRDHFSLTTVRQKLTHLCYLSTFKLAARLKMNIRIMSKVNDVLVRRAIGRKATIEQKLKEKYSDIIYESSQCPFSNNFTLY